MATINNVSGLECSKISDFIATPYLTSIYDCCCDISKNVKEDPEREDKTMEKNYKSILKEYEKRMKTFFNKEKETEIEEIEKDDSISIILEVARDKINAVLKEENRDNEIFCLNCTHNNTMETINKIHKIDNKFEEKRNKLYERISDVEAILALIPPACFDEIKEVLIDNNILTVDNRICEKWYD